MSVTTLTAAELYDAIWSTPLSHLAKRWQVNAHALGQLLDRHGIPRPKSGYWTQKALNKPRAVIPLPDVVFPSRQIDLTPLQTTKREKARLTAVPLPRPVKLAAHFPLLKGIKASMSKPHFKYEFLMVQPYNSSDVARLDVSPAQQRRGIAILHRLFDAFRRENWNVYVEKQRYAKRLTNIVVINGESVPFRLRERLRQQVRDLDKKEQADKANGKTVWHEKINVPSGSLQLYVEGPLPAGIKGFFEDTPSLTLEDQLGHVLHTMVRSADHSKAVKVEREAQRQRWEAQRRKQAAIEQRISAEQQRIQAFTDFFAQWQRANACRTFVEALLGATEYEDCTKAQQASFTAWANAVIDALDPVVNGQAKVLLRADEEDSAIFDEAMHRFAKEH
ncbi:hypothetical protein [Alteromonas genovensis]|uniref:hypothetical protein n=1 Tax=Alteromonas genovensis TaxID=471225 RepID=UPI002FE2596F